MKSLREKSKKRLHLSEIKNSFILSFFKDLDPSHLLLAQLQQNWSKIAGSVAKFSKPYSLKKDILHIAAMGSSLRQEIILRKAQILQDINNFIKQEFPNQKIKELRIKERKNI